ncbi:MAG TPA: M20/M25/M40 family metallo-hydrolase [Gemmatimonadaceae bacterium]|nr:M20/M25/M40 family metallo-hydrolase [Gemmatimonadaceae bacterium]
MSRRFSALLACLALVTACSARAQTMTLNPEQQRLHDIYKELLEINTVDSLGSATLAAQAMQKRFLAAGFPASDVQLFTPKPDKGNLVVRYHGKGARKPLLLLAHLDVVAALRSDWTTDPFKLVEKDGYYYARGSGDDKAMASIFVANMLRMKREGFVPDRDIILALTADEEGGDMDGAEWLVNTHKPVIDAAYAINEGGGGSLVNGNPFLQSVQATEKVSINLTASTHNRGGHSSVPRPDNAIYQLAAGLMKLSAYRFPVQLNDVSRAFFERTAAIESPDIGAAMRAIAKNEKDSAAAAKLSEVPRYASMLRTTCVATRLFGGHANNALPQTATANINCRVVPNVDPAQVRLTLLQVMGDTGITMSAPPPLEPSAPSPLTPELMGAVEQLTKQMFGDIPVIPTMSTGATDGMYLRAKGIPTYGVSGLFGDPNDSRAHGKDERMRVQSLYDGQEFLYRLVKALSSPTTP